MIEWEWFSHSATLHVFIFLVLSANHEDKKWRGNLIKRGQLITSRDQIAKNTGLSAQVVRSALKRLKSTSEITSKSTNSFTLITICNYDTYQSRELNSNQQINQQVNQPSTSEQPAINQPLTTNKNIKNIRTKENIYISEAVENFENDLQEYVPPPADDSPAEQVQIAWTKATGLMVRPKDRLTLENYVNSKGVDWCLQAIQNRNKETYIGQCFFAYEQKTKPKQLPGKTVYDPDVRLFGD